MGDDMRYGNFSKKYSSNLDDITLPSWLVLSESADVTVNKNTGSFGGLIFKRTSTTGSKTLQVPTSPDIYLSAISMDVALNGLSLNVGGSLDIGFYGNATEYAFIRFPSIYSTETKLMLSKNGVETVISPLFIRNLEWSRFSRLKFAYNFKEKTFEVRKNGDTAYLSLDNIDINKAAMVPMIRWNESITTTTDKLLFIEVEKFYL